MENAGGFWTDATVATTEFNSDVTRNDASLV